MSEFLEPVPCRRCGATPIVDYSWDETGNEAQLRILCPSCYGLRDSHKPQSRDTFSHTYCYPSMQRTEAILEWWDMHKPDGSYALHVLYERSRTHD